MRSGHSKRSAAARRLAIRRWQAERDRLIAFETYEPPLDINAVQESYWQYSLLPEPVRRRLATMLDGGNPAIINVVFYEYTLNKSISGLLRTCDNLERQSLRQIDKQFGKDFKEGRIPHILAEATLQQYGEGY